MDQKDEKEEEKWLKPNLKRKIKEENVWKGEKNNIKHTKLVSLPINKTRLHIPLKV